MFEDAPMEERYSPFSVAEAFDCMNPSSKLTKNRKATGNSNRRRFSDDQIRSLERIFESETRLDPQKKVQVAWELGLQPRQVAIWFQNKRARWKSKQLEHDYAVLVTNYTQLASRLETLKNEKHALVSLREKLKGLVGTAEPAAATSADCDQSGEEDETVQLKIEPPTTAEAAMAAVLPAPSLSDDESSVGAVRYLRVSEERDQYWYHHQEDCRSLMMSMDMVDTDCSLTSTHHGPSLGLNSDELLNPGSPNQWWDFWS